MNVVSQACRAGWGRSIGVAAWAAALAVGCASPKTPPTVQHAAIAVTQPMDPTIAAIREEGLNHSHIQDTLDMLCNVIGARLTGSPGVLHASNWTRDQLASWGLSNAHLEEWGPFGRGWSLDRFSMQVTAPYTILLQAYPKAWSPGFDQPIEGEIVYLNARNETDLETYRGKLSGKIVLIGKPRITPAHFDPPATRLDDTHLAALAAAKPGMSSTQVAASLLPATTAPAIGTSPSPSTSPGAGGELPGDAAPRRTGRRSRVNAGSRPTPSAATTEPSTIEIPTTLPSAAASLANTRFADREFAFACAAGAKLILTPSANGDGGTIFVASAAVPTSLPATEPSIASLVAISEKARAMSATAPSTKNATTISTPENWPATQADVVNRYPMLPMPTTAPATQPVKPWAFDAPPIPAQVMLSIESFNRLVRLIAHGEKVTIACDLRVTFHPEGVTNYDTVAEIPGTDLADQVVMVGGHLDSWQSGTGATDNGAGAASAMEAIRILKALDLHPRRTIRVALWTGEEEGLLGSAAYVKQHFGFIPTTGPTAVPPGSKPGTPPTTLPTTLPEYENLSVYFNLDNGTGKIRGIYAQSSDAAFPIFKNWIAPFADLGAQTVTLANTGSTDHISFDKIGLPGFQFLQDPIEYFARTHHSNADTFERLQIDDLKQASTIMAAFMWDAANMDERFPRKPLK